MLAAPERRMSSCVRTKMAAAASATFCVRLDTDVTCMFIRSSTLMVVTSIAFCAGALLFVASAPAQNAIDVTSMSVEVLMNMQGTYVAKRKQKVEVARSAILTTTQK